MVYQIRLYNHGKYLSKWTQIFATPHQHVPTTNDLVNLNIFVLWYYFTYPMHRSNVKRRIFTSAHLNAQLFCDHEPVLRDPVTTSESECIAAAINLINNEHMPPSPTTPGCQLNCKCVNSVQQQQQLRRNFRKSQLSDFFYCHQSSDFFSHLFNSDWWRACLQSCTFVKLAVLWS